MSEGRIKVGKDALDFTLENTQDEPITLSDFEGRKNVYLVFNRGFF
jgi:peroxiredoxin